MIKYLLTNLILVLYISSNGQVVDNFSKKNESNIYNQTLIQYVKYLEKENIKKSDTLFIERDDKLTENIISQVGDIKILIIELKDINKNKLKKEKKFITYKLYPVEFVNQEFRVLLAPYSNWYDENDQLLGINNSQYWASYDFKDGKFLFKEIGILIK
ncbi:MAG: hypothetical protein AB7S48_16970 [Bacteroidales bacterium]